MTRQMLVERKGNTGANTRVTVVAAKRQVTPSLVDIASFAERLSKLTVSGDHAKPLSSDLIRARTAEIVTAAGTPKATLDDSVSC